MKKILLLTYLFLFSCGGGALFVTMNHGGIDNAPPINSNFKYTGHVKGEASSIIVLGAFRIDRGDVYNRALADIYNKTNFYEGTKKGLTNISVDYVHNYFILFTKETCIITASLIEYEEL